MRIQVAYAVLLVSLLMSGCSSMTYSTLDQPAAAAPTGPGINRDASYAVPIYRELPDQPYAPVGVIKFGSPQAQWNEGDIAQAAQVAKRNGGDAMILCNGAGMAVPVIGKAVVDDMNLGAYHTFGIALRWKPAAPAETIAR